MSRTSDVFVDRVKREHSELQTDEVLLRVIKKMPKSRSGTWRPITVLDYLGEQRVAVLGAILGRYSMREFDGGTESQLVRMQAALGLSLRRAVPFLWTHEMRKLALQYEIPNHAIGPSAFPYNLMWWTFETALGFDGTDRHADGMLILRNQWFTTEFPGVIAFSPEMQQGWSVFEFGSDDGRGSTSYIMRLMALPDGTQSAELGDHAVLFGMSAFLNSRFIDVTRRKPSDTDKRWRGRRVGDPSSLNVVTLRASVRDAVAAERGEGPQWHQRWLVRGHLRAQWYPSIKAHQVIWIAPYLKGPEDAPLKVPVYSVSR
jgi:hypothetical protein